MENQTTIPTVEEVQQQYLDAMNSGNAEEIRRIEQQVDGFLAQDEKNKPPVPAPALPTPVAEGTEAEPLGVPSSEGEQGEVSSGSNATEGTQQPPVEKFDEETENWLNGLDKSIRVHVEQKLRDDKKQLALAAYQAEHQTKADNGRVAAYQGRYSEAQRKIAQLKQQLQQQAKQPQPSVAATNKGEVGKPSFSLDDDPDLKQIAETDEQLARVFQRREQAFQEKINGLTQLIESSIAPLKRASEDQKIGSELNRLQQFVPNAVEIFNYTTPEGVNVWEDWAQSQPEGVKSLAFSDRAEDVARALELYGFDMERQYGSYQQRQPDAPTQVNVDPRVAGLAQERERKLQAQPVGSQNVRPPQKVKPTDAEILSNPVLLEKEQQRIFEEEMKKYRAG